MELFIHFAKRRTLGNGCPCQPSGNGKLRKRASRLSVTSRGFECIQANGRGGDADEWCTISPSNDSKVIR